MGIASLSHKDLTPRANAQHIAYFITPHGFGHATRAAAIMAAAQRCDPTIHFDIFTHVPRWIFDQSLDADAARGYHPTLSDIGLAQYDALHEDIAETVRRLDAFLPFRPQVLDSLARQVLDLGCRMVVCDVAPLGIAVAQAAGLPSVLIENFTWDWIYGGYLEEHAPETARLAQHIEYLRDVFKSASQHVQTEPVCLKKPCDLVTAPVSRLPRLPRAEVRRRLGIPHDARLVLLTMGGVAGPDHAVRRTFIDQLVSQREAYFVFPGGSEMLRTDGHLVRLPNESAFYHPDILNASDAVIGKTGYSTVCEAYHAGLPFGYVARPRFRESGVMAAYIQAHMRGIEFSEGEFQSGAWLTRLPDLLALGRIEHTEPNGADQAADFLVARIVGAASRTQSS